MLGIELKASGAIAVAVGDDGAVRARAESASAEPASAAVEALERVKADGARALGIAAAAPDAPAAAAAVEAIGRRFKIAPGIADLLPSGTAAAIAEAWVGAGRSGRDIVLFCVSDRSTAGIVRHGRPVTGAHGRAGAVAWLSLNPVEREDYRKNGCLEAEVAGAGLVRRLIWRIKAGDRSRAQEMAGGDLAALTVDHVLDAARQNDGVAFSVVRDTAKYLGMAAANLVAIADPDTLVLGGIMATAADLLFEPVCVDVGRRLPAAMLQGLSIVPAELGADAAAIGAARHAGAAK